MTASVVQLHIAPDELLSFIYDVVREYNLHIVLMKFNPNFICENVPDAQKLSDAIDLRAGQEVVLLLKEPRVEGANQLEFYDHNPDYISFDFGKWLPQGLRQSSVSYKADDAATISVGKDIFRKIKNNSKTGVLIINPRTGVSAISKTYRFTSGALALERSGVPMLPIGGNLAKLDARDEGAE